MNWITKALNFGEKIKKAFKRRATKEELENSDWTSCCKGPILKKELEENLWVCNSCNKHHRISCRQRFDIFFGKNSYEIIDTPQPADDPLNWVDTKSYKDRLKIARKKTNQNCAVMISKGMIDRDLNIEWVCETHLDRLDDKLIDIMMIIRNGSLVEARSRDDNTKLYKFSFF